MQIVEKKSAPQIPIQRMKKIFLKIYSMCQVYYK